jgi:outer membrane lipoprotein-sorting protein
MDSQRWALIGRVRLGCSSFITFCFLLISLGLAAEATDRPEKPGAKAEAFAHIAAATVTLQTISSNFTQEKHVSMLREPLLSSGRFVYERPDRLHWETDKPSPAGFVVSGGKAKRWVGDPRKAETFDVQKDPVAKAIVEQVFAWARADYPWLEKRYRITVMEDKPTSLRLLPLSSQEKKYISHINITFSEDWSHVSSVDIYEKGEDYVRIIFSHTLLNEPVRKDLFAP